MQLKFSGKAVLGAVLLSCVLLSSNQAQAYGNYWLSGNVDWNRVKTAVVFKNEGVPEGNIVSAVLLDNAKRLKGMQLLPLHKTFAEEKARAQAVREAGGDIYVVPYVREYEVQKDYVEGKVVRVSLESWREVTSPYRNWTSPKDVEYDDHFISPGYTYLNKTAVDYYVYDNQGQLVMLYGDSRYAYTVKNKENLQEITREFFNEIKNASKAGVHKQIKAGGAR